MIEIFCALRLLESRFDFISELYVFQGAPVAEIMIRPILPKGRSNETTQLINVPASSDADGGARFPGRKCKRTVAPRREGFHEPSGGGAIRVRRGCHRRGHSSWRSRLSYGAAFQTIVGSWLTTANGGGASEPFKALATFSADGNVIFVTQGEAAGNPLFTAEHGVWGCIGSRYTFTFLEINYNPDGSFAGIFKVRANIGLHASGDEIEVRLVFEFRDANGILQQTGTGTGTGKRIKLEPLG